MKSEPDYNKHGTFNGLVETAMRLLIVLERLNGIAVDFEELRVLDFFVVFAEDLGGPKNAHVPLSGRGGAFRIRGEHYLGSALTFLQRANLISIEGLMISAIHPSDDSVPFTSTYLQNIDAAAFWMATEIASKGRQRAFAKFRKKLTPLLEMSLSARPPADDEKFNLLKVMYPADLDRLAGLVDACGVFISYLFHDHKSAANNNGPELPSFDYFYEVAAAARKEASKIDVNHKGLLDLLEDLHKTRA